MYFVIAALGIHMMSQHERSIIHLSNERVIETQKVKGENGLRQTCKTGYRFFFFVSWKVIDVIQLGKESNQILVWGMD